MEGVAFNHLRALIVEDNPHVRALLHSLLNTLGITEICEAENGTDAFAKLQTYKPDLILTDLTMGPVNGIAFVREVRRSKSSPNPFVPIILITGHTEKHWIAAARDAGVTEIVVKPITAQNFFQRIADIVERPRPFIRCTYYFGPDRRRQQAGDYAGPWRRESDFAGGLVVDKRGQRD